MASTSRRLTSTKKGTISIQKIVPGRGALRFFLNDGREVAIPIKDIPEIKKLKHYQRREWQIFGDEGIYNLFAFESTDEIFKLTDELKIEVG